MPKNKHAILTFKAEDSLVDALRAVPNRSAFIRSAILAALDNVCPLCQGTGILNPEQRRHWDTFAKDHAVKECRTCQEWHLVCAHELAKSPHQRKA